MVSDEVPIHFRGVQVAFAYIYLTHSSGYVFKRPTSREIVKLSQEPRKLWPSQTRSNCLFPKIVPICRVISYSALVARIRDASRNFESRQL